MIDHPATIEFIEKCGELFKNLGALMVRYSQQLKGDPAQARLEARLLGREPETMGRINNARDVKLGSHKD